MREAPYIPASGRFLPVSTYDRSIALTMREDRWRPLVARLAAGGTVVEVGAGTGQQAVALAQAGDRVIAVDGDPDALAIARSKPGAEGVEFREGFAGSLPVDDGAAHSVVMTLLLHHLDGDGKRAAFAEAVRVLRPGGRIVIADWGRARGVLGPLGTRTLAVFDSAAGMADHAAGRLPELLARAGFETARMHRRLPTVWGTLEVMTASRPE